MPVFLKERITTLKKNLKIFTIFAVVFAAGMILGIIFNLKSGDKNPTTKSVTTFYQRICNPEINAFSIEIKFFFNCALMLCIFFTLSFSVYLLPVSFAIIFVRGIICGGAIVAYIVTYKLSGAMVFLLINLVQTVVSYAVFCALVCINGDFFTQGKCRVKRNLKYKLLTALICLIVCFAVTVYGFFAISLILRPLYLIF